MKNQIQLAIIHGTRHLSNNEASSLSQFELDLFIDRQIYVKISLNARCMLKWEVSETFISLSIYEEGASYFFG